MTRTSTGPTWVTQVHSCLSMLPGLSQAHRSLNRPMTRPGQQQWLQSTTEPSREVSWRQEVGRSQNHLEAKTVDPCNPNTREVDSHNFKASLGYREKCCLKNTKREKKNSLWRIPMPWNL